MNQMKTMISCFSLFVILRFLGCPCQIMSTLLQYCKYRLPACSYWAFPQLRTCRSSVDTEEKHKSVEVHVGGKKEGQSPQNKIAFQRSLIKLAGFSHFVPNAS